MEFGMMGLEGLVSSGTGFASSDHEKQKCCGSAGFLKQEDVDDGCRASKIAKVRDDLSTSVSKGSSIANFSEDGQQHHNMLSFSSSKLEDFSLKCSGGLDIKNLQKSAAFPTYFQHPTSPYTKISGYSCTGGGGLNASMYMLNGVKGPFTPGQWIELEQQALIYKYIISNEPIPPTLLLPIRRALESAGFFSFPGGLLRPNSYGWGPFHLGFSNSTDPEPGRCRRTDGKKWRCSREAVPDQKYCERHMNRGRHRSRKPVEGRSSGRSVSGSTPTTTKLTNPSSPAALVVPAGATSNSFAPDHTTSSLVDRLLGSKQNGSQETQGAMGLNCLSSSINLNSNASTFSILEDQIPFTESAPMSFGVLTSDALYRTYSSTHDVNAPEPDPQHLACSFTGDFMSSTSAPTREEVAISPLRISGELEMGLGVTSERTQKHSNWVPISWETSMGGPLGEALKTTSNSSESHSRNVSSALNLLSKGWDGSPHLAASSPTGVLQRTPLGSLSNSSAGSSPRADNGRGLESGSLCVDNIGPTLGN